MAYKIKSIRFTLNKARLHQVKELDYGRGWYEVTSCNSGNTYLVDLKDIRCQCDRDEWITEENGHVNHCSHVQAALIYRALKAGYWIVARAEEADVSHLKRKVVTLRAPGRDHGDGVKWTARKIDTKRAKAKLRQIEKGPRTLQDSFIRQIARQEAKRVIGQEAV